MRKDELDTQVLPSTLYKLLRRIPLVRNFVPGIKRAPRKKEKTPANRLVNP